MAVDLALPILPVSIIGTKDILPSNSMKLFPGSARMVIHKPIDCSGYNDDNIQKLIEETRSVIKSSFDEASVES